jgi:hypothetical protein
MLFPRVSTEPNLPVGYRTSPFRGVADLYTPERVSTADSIVNAPILMWRIDTRVPGGVLLKPSQRQVRGA